MRLHMIELKNWRKHAEKRIEFDEKTTVIYGSNETGKSTILEALSRAFFDRSSSTALQIRKIKPLTALGNVSSIVKIEFSLKDKKYFVEKKFNLNRGTALYRVFDSNRILLAQDVEADRLLIEMLEAELQTSSVSKPSKWGAFYWLWTPQDNRELPTEGDPTRSLHLDQRSGTLLVTPKYHTVVNEINRRFTEYFTAKAKKKKNSPISLTEVEIRNLRSRSQELNLRIRNVDDYKMDLEGKLTELPKLEEILKTSKEDIEKAREAAKDFSVIEAELETSKTKLKEIERNIKDLSNAINEIEEASQKIVTLQDEEQDIRGNLSQIIAFCDHLETELSSVNITIEEKSKKRSDLDDLTADARILYTKKNTMQQISEHKKKIIRIEELNIAIEELRSKEKLLQITQNELDEFTQTEFQVKLLKERLLESGLFINITPGKKGTLKVEVDGITLDNTQLEVTGTENVQVSAKNLGMVTIRADLQKARDIKADVERSESQIKKTLNKYSVGSFDELKQIHSAQMKLTSDMNQYIAEKKGIDERSLEEIKLNFESLKEKYQGYAKNKRSKLAIQENPIDINLGALIRKRESELKETIDELVTLREKREELTTKFDVKRQDRIKLQTRQEIVTRELTKARAYERDVIIKKYGSQANQEKLLTKENETLKTHKENHDAIEKRYMRLKQGPLTQIKTLMTRIKNQEQIIQQHRTAIDQLRGQIIENTLEGAYSQLSDIESQIEVLEERVQKETLQAQSIKCLKDTLEKQYQQALKSVVKPIKQDVEKYLAHVTGYLHKEVELSDDLLPLHIGEQGIEDLSLTFEDGSSGLKEILTLCVRLAVAKHLSERETQCVVLDDPFVHVSSDRSERMIELINNVIEENALQVIILTHRPMEFASFSGKMVDIKNP